MTVQELYSKARESNLLEEDVHEVILYLRMPKVLLSKGVCAMCANRKIPDCPYPYSNTLTSPKCESFVELKNK